MGGMYGTTYAPMRPDTLAHEAAHLAGELLVGGAGVNCVEVGAQGVAPASSMVSSSSELSPCVAMWCASGSPREPRRLRPGDCARTSEAPRACGTPRPWGGPVNRGSPATCR